MFVRSFKIRDLKKWEKFKELADRLRVSRGCLIRKAIDYLLKNPAIAEVIVEEVDEA